MTLVIVGIAGVSLTAAIGYINAVRDEAAMDDMYHDRLMSVMQILQFKYAITEVNKRSYQLAAFSHLLPPDRYTTEARRMLELHETALKLAQDNVDAFGRSAIDGESRKMWDSFETQWRRWKETESEAKRFVEERITAPSAASMSEISRYLTEENFKKRALTQELTAMVDKFGDLKRDGARRSFDEAIGATRNMIKVNIGAFVLAITLIGLIAWSIFRSVIKPIRYTRNLVVRIANEQNLTLRVDHSAGDEIGEMVAAFNQMVEKIQRSVVAINDRVELVNKEVVSFSKEAESVALESQAQSTAASSMAASVEEMTVSISSVSDNASDAQKVAQNAGEISGLGSQIIDKTSREMDVMVEIVLQTSQVIQTLGEESHQINSVVQVIKDVADQINLLALNAAIEAARAGDQGRGFAVVADEVRKLAECTSKSIDDITAMINKIQASASEAVEAMDKVVHCVEQEQKLAKDAGEKMRHIHDQTKTVSGAIDEISNALKEQSLASQDIAKNIEKVSQMTCKNSESADAAAANAKQLGLLAREVKETLSRFKA
jgi:methyl-accepting chemotaxis protein